MVLSFGGYFLSFDITLLCKIIYFAYSTRTLRNTNPSSVILKSLTFLSCYNCGSVSNNIRFKFFILYPFNPLYWQAEDVIKYLELSYFIIMTMKRSLTILLKCNIIKNNLHSFRILNYILLIIDRQRETRY